MFRLVIIRISIRMFLETSPEHCLIGMCVLRLVTAANVTPTIKAIVIKFKQICICFYSILRVRLEAG